MKDDTSGGGIYIHRIFDIRHRAIVQRVRQPWLIYSTGNGRWSDHYSTSRSRCRFAKIRSNGNDNCARAFRERARRGKTRSPNVLERHDRAPVAAREIDLKIPLTLINTYDILSDARAAERKRNPFEPFNECFYIIDFLFAKRER